MESYENDIKKWNCLWCSKIITTGKISYHYKDSIYCSKDCLIGKKILNQCKINTYNLKIKNNKNEFYKIKSSSNIFDDFKNNQQSKIINKKKSSENLINLKRSNSINESITYSEKKLRI